MHDHVQRKVVLAGKASGRQPRMIVSHGEDRFRVEATDPAFGIPGERILREREPCPRPAMQAAVPQPANQGSRRKVLVSDSTKPALRN
jgi:hypothetical protein